MFIIQYDSSDGVHDSTAKDEVDLVSISDFTDAYSRGHASHASMLVNRNKMCSAMVFGRIVDQIVVVWRMRCVLTVSAA